MRKFDQMGDFGHPLNNYELGLIMHLRMCRTARRLARKYFALAASAELRRANGLDTGIAGAYEAFRLAERLESIGPRALRRALRGR